MAGVLRKVIPKTSFDFTGLGFSSTSAVFPLGDPLDATKYSNAGIVVRVHNLNIGTNNYITVGLYDDGFLDGSEASFAGGADAVAVTISPSSGTPSAQFSSWHILGQYLTVGIQGVNGATMALNQVTISVDVYLKNGDDVPLQVRGGRLHSVDEDAPPAQLPVLNIPHVPNTPYIAPPPPPPPQCIKLNGEQAAMLGISYYCPPGAKPNYIPLSETTPVSGVNHLPPLSSSVFRAATRTWFGVTKNPSAPQWLRRKLLTR